MEGKLDTNRVVVAARLVWLATFVIPLVLAGLLLAVKTAHAAPVKPAVIPFDLEEDFELEEETESDPSTECAEATGEFEAGELEADDLEEICAGEEDEDRKKAGPGSLAPEECLLRSAHARVAVNPLHKTVRLTVGYTTYEPTPATVDYGLTGNRGSLHLGTEKRFLGRSGVIRLTKSVTDAQMSKIEAGGRFTVRLHSTEAPSSCRRFETEELTVKHASKRLAVWSPAA